MTAALLRDSTIKRLKLAAGWLLVAATLASCASSEITGRNTYDSGGYIPRPERIVIYDFASTLEGMAPYSAASGEYEVVQEPQHEQVIRLGQELGRLVANALVADIRAMGLPAEWAYTGQAPNVGSLTITGEFVSIDEGNRKKRMIIGFGSGSGELSTVVEKHLITVDGPRLLKTLGVKATGGKGPGVAAPLIIVGGLLGRPGQALVVSGSLNILQELGPEKIQAAAERTAEAISEELREGFRRRGWI